MLPDAMLTPSEVHLYKVDSAALDKFFKTPGI